MLDRTDTLELLLEAGADPNRPDGMGRSPLTSAVTRGNAQDVRLLLAHGADPNVYDEIAGSPLSLACLQGNAGCSRALLEGGARVPAGEQARHMLFSARMHGSEELVQVLTEHGVQGAEPRASDQVVESLGRVVQGLAAGEVKITDIMREFNEALKQRDAQQAPGSKSRSNLDQTGRTDEP